MSNDNHETNNKLFLLIIIGIQYIYAHVNDNNDVNIDHAKYDN